MLRLRPCPACRRHVSVSDETCAFCAASLPPSVPGSEPLSRLSRAAVFVAGVASTGCWTSTPTPSSTPPVQSSQSSTSAPADAAVQPRLVPDTDEPDPDYQDHPCVSPGPGQPPVCAPYGAPPARRRIV